MKDMLFMVKCEEPGNDIDNDLIFALSGQAAATILDILAKAPRDHVYRVSDWPGVFAAAGSLADGGLAEDSPRLMDHDEIADLDIRPAGPDAEAVLDLHVRSGRLRAYNRGLDRDSVDADLDAEKIARIALNGIRAEDAALNAESLWKPWADPSPKPDSGMRKGVIINRKDDFSIIAVFDNDLIRSLSGIDYPLPNWELGGFIELGFPGCEIFSFRGDVDRTEFFEAPYERIRDFVEKRGDCDRYAREIAAEITDKGDFRLYASDVMINDDYCSDVWLEMPVRELCERLRLAHAPLEVPKERGKSIPRKPAQGMSW